VKPFTLSGVSNGFDALALASAAAVVLLLTACPSPIPLDCLSCTSDVDCAPDGLRCVLGRCEGARQCTPRDGGSPQLFFLDDFETGTFLKTDAPSGKWDSLQVGDLPDQILSVAEQAALGGRYGLQVIDRVDAGPGYDVGRGTVVALDTVDGGKPSSLNLRYHVRLTSTTMKAGPFPIQLHGNVPGSTMAEMAIVADGQVGLKCGGQLNPDQGCNPPGMSTAPMSFGDWHVVQISLEGYDGSDGGCTLWLDEQLVCTQPVDWSGAQIEHMLGGSTALNLEWQGVLDVDDVSITGNVPAADHLVLAGASIAVAGHCTPYSLQTNDLTATIAPAVVTLDGGHAFSGFDCLGSEVTTVTIPEGGNQVPVSFKFDAPGEVTVTATDVGNADLQPASRKITVQGSGCTQAPGLMPLLIVAWMRRRSSQVVRARSRQHAQAREIA
jgi:hypothetical protein